MSFKIGNDIIEVERIKNIYMKNPDHFKNKIFTEREIDYCESKGINKFQSYAARFAAKEAVFKAISDLMKNDYEIEWKQIEILNKENGKPFVNIIKDIEIKNIDISLSHINEIALASVIIEY